MKQSRLESAIEATANIASGFIVSYCVWLWVIPFFWPHLKSSHATNLMIVTLFTITSWLRSYGWRRFFEAGVHKLVHRWFNNKYPNRREQE